MTAMEPNINIQTESAVMPGNIPNATQVSDFGGALNNIENVSRGTDVLDFTTANSKSSWMWQETTLETLRIYNQKYKTK